MTELDTSHLPPVLARLATVQWRRFQECLDTTASSDLTACFDATPVLRAEVATAFAASEFLAETAIADAAGLIGFLTRGEHLEAPDDVALARRIEHALHGADDFDALGRALRRLRRGEMLRLVWREATRRSHFRETAAAVSNLADRLISAALDRLYAAAVAVDGEPIGDESGTPVQLCVVALGKLGAGELNLSSDVDLVFAYREEGRTANGRRTNRQFFIRLGQRLIQALDTVTADGFVFRVDMRLRPYGDSGALVYHFDAMELYFEEQGRDWERYAWIRARPCAGSLTDGCALIESLRPFVYRRYLDFGAIQALREMKARVDAERSTERVRDDVKLGPGGIREVEFVVQMHQLVWGGRIPELRGVSTLDNLERLVTFRKLDRDEADQLAAAYVFLRDTEHRIQAIRDEQTQRLPDGDPDRARLTLMSGYESWDAFVHALSAHRRNVALQFEPLIREPDTPRGEDSERYRLAWEETDPERLAERLALLGFADAASLVRLLEGLRTARSRPWVGTEGRARLDELMPRVFEAAAGTDHPTIALSRIVPLLEAVLRRSAYFVLLLENPHVLAELVAICAASRWLAEELAQHPMLLDELLDPGLLYTVPDRAALARDLRSRLASISGEGLERRLDTLRVFKETHQFRVAACELKGILPLMKISDYLTFLAEVILAEALDFAWRDAAQEHGVDPEVPGPFIIVGYGKLGGLELGPGSDLDLVFVHDLGLDHGRFLNRMVRRLLHVLTTRTHTGALYEVDMRLRPSGRSGPMVSSLAGFAEYQTSEAWVWEHQALVRARVVAGDLSLGARFDAVRIDILRRPRDRERLKQEIVAMRARIERIAEDDADFKRAAGGIVDIEFMVQYLTLAWASEHPELCEFTDNVRILDAAARVQLLPQSEVEGLKQAYLALRAESHRAALDVPDAERARTVLAQHYEVVRESWNNLLGVST